MTENETLDPTSAAGGTMLDAVGTALVGADWPKIGGYVILFLNITYLIYGRWYAAHLRKYPTLMARKQLYGYLCGILGNPRAWYAANDACTVAFNLDENANAATNSTTGQVKAAGLPCVKIKYDKAAPTITMANGKNVFDKLSKSQRKHIINLARAIGGELTEIAEAQSILSMVPSRA